MQSESSRFFLVASKTDNIFQPIKIRLVMDLDLEYGRDEQESATTNLEELREGGPRFSKPFRCSEMIILKK